MKLRLLLAVSLASALAFAAEHRPVCADRIQGEGRCHVRVIVDSRGYAHSNVTPSGYGPAQLTGAYSLPAASTGAGAGQTIGIVDAYDAPNIESDLGVYSTQFGLPACTTANGCFKKVNQTGGTKYPRANSGWALEISLDVEIAHAICPNCKILLVEATSATTANLIAAEQYATAHATVVSNSWGGGESSGQTSYDKYFKVPGVPITVSSGDSGYGVEWPASSQYVTAVGGTTLNISGTTYVSETVWSGAGSGCSAYEAKPSWQTDTKCSKRTVADVAAVADPNTGAAVYDSTPYSGQSGWWQVGGTSLAAPLIAAVYALAGNGTATLYGSFPYGTASAPFLHDVTSGSNGSCSGSYLCTGTTGYDGPTGVGTPNGTNAF